MAKAKIVDLSTVRARDALRPRPNRHPHWQRLQPSLFLGYRPAADRSAGTWSAQAKRREQVLGSFAQFPANERFAKAKAAAEAFATLVDTGVEATAPLITVTDAARAYLADHPRAVEYFRLSVFSDPIGAIPLRKLRPLDLAEWRKRLVGRPVKGTSRERAPASVNREIAPLRAALRKALAPGKWQEELKPISRAISVRSRTLYLDRQERLALLDNASADVQPFLRALCLIPVRPGAVAKLTVGDFVRKTGSLTIRDDKGHPERFVHVGVAAAALLTAQSRDKTPAAPLFMRADGAAWNRDTWKGPVKAAVLAAGLDKSASAYTLRHCVITDLVAAGIPILTIAHIAGTTVEMIEKHYGQYRQDAARKALDAIAL